MGGDPLEIGGWQRVEKVILVGRVGSGRRRPPCAFQCRRSPGVAGR